MSNKVYEQKTFEKSILLQIWSHLWTFATFFHRKSEKNAKKCIGYKNQFESWPKKDITSKPLNNMYSSYSWVHLHKTRCYLSGFQRCCYILKIPLCIDSFNCTCSLAKISPKFEKGLNLRKLLNLHSFCINHINVHCIQLEPEI